MSGTDEEYLRTVEEYKNFDIDGYKKELSDQFETEVSGLQSAQAAHRGDGEKIQQYERLHTEHQALQKDNLAASDERRQVLADIADSTNKFDAFATEAVTEKRGLRDNLANLEDTLRRLKDNLSTATLENTNLQLVVDTESALKDAKAGAETQAVTSVNTDLKDQVARIQKDIAEETEKKAEAQRILADLTEKHKAATAEFEKSIQSAEKEKGLVQKTLTELRAKVQGQNQENSKLESEVSTNEKTIGRLNAEISQLQSDLAALKSQSQIEIDSLETQREDHETTITKFRDQLAEADHDFAKLRILIQKTQNEVEYLNSEKDKHESQNYQKRIDDFTQSVADSEKRTGELAEELNKMNEDWKQRLLRTVKETEDRIRENEAEEHAQKIKELTEELDAKNREIDELKAKRDELEREVSTEPTASHNQKIDAAKAELEETNQKLVQALDEKNNLYDELVKSTKELLDTNEQIQTNAQEIARLSQELDFLRKQLEQKEKIIYDLKIELELKRQQIEDMKEEIAQKKEHVANLEDQLRALDEEAEAMKQAIAERDAQIKDLEAKLAEMNAPVPEEPEPEEAKAPAVYEADRNDEVDQMLAQFLNVHNCPVPIKRLGGGYYIFGTKKIYAKIMNGRLVIRVGGGYMVIDEFIQTYAQQELVKIQAKRAAGEDPFAAFEDELRGSPKRGGSPRGSAKGSPKRGSPRASAINGSKRGHTLTAGDIERYKASGAAREM